MNLYDANRQWANRPDDERYESLEQMQRATEAYAKTAFAREVATNELRAEARNGDLYLVGTAGKYAKVTHYSFGQLTNLVGAPASYLRDLPATLAAQNLNHGLKVTADERQSLNLLFHRRDDSDLIARAVTSMAYDRVWNHEVLSRVMGSIAGTGWRPPPARPCREGQAGVRLATAADILPNQGDFGLAIKVGDPIAPAGLYASDHDMFAFLVNNENPIFDGQKYLQQGVFIQNSEVGDCSLRFKMFVYDNVCGNHIVWGVGSVTDASFRHIKSTSKAQGLTLTKAMAAWRKFLNQGDQQARVKAMEAQIKHAREMIFGASKDEVVDQVGSLAVSKGLNLLTRTNVEKAFDIAEATPRYGSPTSLWGVVNGLTELSQSGYTDLRTELDIQAGKLMRLCLPQ